MSNPHNLASLESLDEGPVRLTTCRKWEHALYPNEADKAQQLGMMVSFIDVGGRNSHFTLLSTRLRYSRSDEKLTLSVVHYA